MDKSRPSVYTLAMGSYIVITLLGILLILILWAILRLRDSRSLIEDEIRQTLASALLDEREHTGEALRRQGADLAERIVRSSADLRQSMTDRLAAEFREIQDRLEGRLGQGRRELQEGLLRTTEALERKFAALQQATQSDLEGIRNKVDERLMAIGREVQSKLDQNLREGFQHFERVQQHLKTAEVQLQNVGQVGASINELNALLKLPHLRGGFGEATLERLLMDILPAHLYELQASIPGAGKVDALVHFPKASLPIDSKFPREQVLPLFQASAPEKLAMARKSLGQVLKVEASRIAKYIRPESGTMDMALMFLPSETLYFEAIRDAKLWEELGSKKVYPVSPNTLAVTLRGIAIAHDYYQMASNVEKTLEEVQKAKRHFQFFQQRFEDLGKGLTKAQEAFRTASTHLDRYAGSVERLTALRETPSLPEDAQTEEETR